jgi:peptide/nickel transport system substrate-binding protein
MDHSRRVSRHPGRWALGLATALAVVLAGCSSSGSSPASSGSSPASAATSSAQSITWAEQPASAPNCIFPLGPLTCYTSTNNSSFQNLMYRPLYWLGQNGSVNLDESLSLAGLPVWNSSSTALTIHLKPYKWSNGTPVTARNVLFFFNLIKANKTSWEPYSPGTFPDDIVSMTAVNPTTISMKLDRSYNRNWFLYTQLSQITPWPLAWDVTAFPAGVTATSGSLPASPSGTLPDATASGAKAVAAFLEAQAKSTAGYGRSPVWSIVDGPWKITQLTTAGLAQFTRNPDYSGPSNNKAKTFTELPFTSSSAEFNQLLSSQGSTSLGSNPGNQVSVGYIPAQDVSEKSRVTSSGYATSTSYPLAFDFMVVNMQNAQVGPMLKQLYVRQALQSLIDQPTWINAFYRGVAVPTYGPIPLKPTNSFAAPIQNPYPFSITAATALLSKHGWSVHAGGTTTCATPSKCGPGITAGEALKFKLLYVSGDTSLNNAMAAFASNASKIGVDVQLSSGPFSQVTGNVVPICKPGDASTACAWQMLDWGGWIYNGGYPSGEQLFASGANGNYGGWSSPVTDSLITETVRQNTAGNQAMNAYQENIAKNLPGVLFLPSEGSVVAAATGLTHFSVNPFYNLDPENW